MLWLLCVNGLSQSPRWRSAGSGVLLKGRVHVSKLHSVTSCQTLTLTSLLHPQSLKNQGFFSSYDFSFMKSENILLKYVVLNLWHSIFCGTKKEGFCECQWIQNKFSYPTKTYSGKKLHAVFQYVCNIQNLLKLYNNLVYTTGPLNAWIWLADERSKVCNYFQGNARRT